MAETFLLEVATPERRLVAEEASEAQIPAANGYVGILPGHAALLAELGTGRLSYQAGGHQLILSPFLLAETERILNYPRMQSLYRLSPAEVQEHIMSNC